MAMTITFQNARFDSIRVDGVETADQFAGVMVAVVEMQSRLTAQAPAVSVETPKVETPKVETPKVETPKVETPKVETLRPPPPPPPPLPSPVAVPRSVSNDPPPSTDRRGPGRPPKSPESAEPEQGLRRGPGRPPKEGATRAQTSTPVSEDAPRRGPGRPPKSASPERLPPPPERRVEPEPEGAEDEGSDLLDQVNSAQGTLGVVTHLAMAGMDALDQQLSWIEANIGDIPRLRRNPAWRESVERAHAEYQRISSELDEES